MDKRRDFLKKSALGGLAVAMSARSYGNILGANDRLNVCVMGTNSRGGELTRNYIDSDNVGVSYIAEPDALVLQKTLAMVKERQGKKAKGVADFRKALEDKDLDILVIAAPDHWHTPASILALQAGKHVYVEKPCGHNPREGELLVEAQAKYGKIVQMGNQQRSGLPTIQAINDIAEGMIGRAYFAKAWYANRRGSIGRGKAAPVPEHLDYEMWQGPAPRREYMDNLIHYNWHWFWNWGTGEICNNGTHEIDIARWALGVSYPERVTSNGGRFHFDDDWEFYDTQIANYDFPGGKTITWEGRSCNNAPLHGWGRGVSVHGTEGTMYLDRNYYRLFDQSNKMVKEVTADQISATTDLVGGGNLTMNHIDNFLAAIRDGAEQNAPISEGHISVLLCHLGNIAQEKGRSLKTDPSNGRILDDEDAMKMWSREYEKGWEPKL